MAISSLFGFFYRIGSLDFPLNYDPDTPFGFVAGNATPIFKYSINDVERALTACQSLAKRSFYAITPDGSMEIGGSLGTDTILAEASGGNAPIKTEDITTEYWDAVFKAIEFLYNNQSRVFQPPTSSDYTSWGDQMLASVIKPGTNNEDNVFFNTRYKKGSFTYKLSGIQGGIGRLEYVSFSINFQSGAIPFQIYFDADAFVERADNISYKVYRYEDLDSPANELISPDEMKTQVVEKMFAFTRTGKYKTVRDYFIDKRVSDGDEFFREQFFVFSTLNRAIDDDVARLAIKQYLMDRYNDMVYLRYTYPSLFSENEIRLIPLYDNFSTSVGGTQNLLYSANLSRLEKELRLFGYDIVTSSANYKPAELFHVGPGSSWISSGSSVGSAFGYFFPIIAVEQQTESGITLPISGRFPNWRPIYGTNEGGDDATFHSILVTLIQFLMGIFNSLQASFVSEYSCVVYEPGQGEGGNASPSGAIVNRKRVSFAFKGDLWFIYGPLQGAAPNT